MKQPNSLNNHKQNLLDFSIKVENNKIFLNDLLLQPEEIPRLIRPYISRLNLLLVKASTQSVRRISPDRVAEDIGKIMGVQTRVENGKFEVFCDETNTWKLVDSFDAQECSSCKKAKLIRQLSLMSNSNKNGRINTSAINL